MTSTSSEHAAATSPAEASGGEPAPPAEPAGAARPHLGAWDVAKFFLPLVLNTEMQQISHGIIYGFLARLPRPKLILAGYSVAFASNQVLNTPNWTSPFTALSFVSDKRSVFRVVRFYWMVIALPFLAMNILAWTPLGDWVYGGLMGASREVVAEAKLCTFFIALVMPFISIRGVSQALIMLNRRTALVGIGTVIRLSSLAGWLAALPLVLHGAAVGGAALTLCLITETFFTSLMARPFYRELPPDLGQPVTARELWRFTWPLMINQSTENGTLVIVNFFLGRLHAPDLALAAFGVANGLVRMLISPLRNLIQTAQTLVRSREDFQAVLRFSNGAILAFVAGLFLLFNTPLAAPFLQGMMGLTAELAAYTLPGLQIAFVVTVFWGYSSLCRGLIAATKNTRSLATSAGSRMLAVLAVGAITLVYPGVNGTLVGVIAITSAFAIEAVVLSRRLISRHASGDEAIFRSRAG